MGIIHQNILSQCKGGDNAHPTWQCKITQDAPINKYHPQPQQWRVAPALSSSCATTTTLRLRRRLLHRHGSSLSLSSLTPPILDFYSSLSTDVCSAQSELGSSILAPAVTTTMMILEVVSLIEEGRASGGDDDGRREGDGGLMRENGVRGLMNESSRCWIRSLRAFGFLR